MLRAYASGGLLVPAAVDRWSGYRYYAPEQLREARLILLLRQAGVRFREMAALVKARAAAQLRQWEQALDLETGSRRDALAEVRDLLAADFAHGTEPGAAPSATALQWGSATLAGTGRNENQDALLTSPPLFAVADGLGGSPGGQIASQLALDTLQACLTAPASFEALVQAASQAGHAVWQPIEADHSLNGMGTTLTAASALQDNSPSPHEIVNIIPARADTYADAPHLNHTPSPSDHHCPTAT